LPGQPVSSRYPINAKNHPLRLIKINSRFFMVAANRLGGVEIVQHVLTGFKPGFKTLAVGFQFVHIFSRDQVMKTLIADAQGTKYALAEIVAKWFSEELSQSLPQKRKLGDPVKTAKERLKIFNGFSS
jgi:hypothetical protein